MDLKNLLFIIGVIVVIIIIIFASLPGSKSTPLTLMKPGYVFPTGVETTLVSPNKQFRMRFVGSNGALTVDMWENNAWKNDIWKNGYDIPGKYSLHMQKDGNLVIYTDKNSSVWASGTHNNPGAYLELSNDGDLIIRNAYGKPLKHIYKKSPFFNKYV